VAAAAVFSVPSSVLAQVCTDDSDCGLGLVCRAGNCAVERSINVSATVPGKTSTGGGGVSPPSVRFEGKAYPGALVIMYRDGIVTATALAGADALFSKDLNGLPTGTHTFSFEAEDTEGRTSSTIEITLSLANDTKTTISNILLPPTIDIFPQIEEDKDGRVFGHMFPGSNVSVFIDTLLRDLVIANGVGEWEYIFDPSLLGLGTHTTKASAISPGGAVSDFSFTKVFEIVKEIIFLPPGVPSIPEIPLVPFPPTPPEIIACPHGDLNGDGRVNLIDFSIMLFWWERAAACPDQNQDGTVDIIDVSILLFWWTN